MHSIINQNRQSKKIQADPITSIRLGDIKSLIPSSAKVHVPYQAQYILYGCPSLLLPCLCGFGWSSPGQESLGWAIKAQWNLVWREKGQYHLAWSLKGYCGSFVLVGSLSLTQYACTRVGLGYFGYLNIFSLYQQT